MYVSRVLNMHSLAQKAAFAAAVLVLSACGGQPTEDVANQPSLQLSLSPASSSVVLSGNITFAGVNGTEPYTFGLVSGAGTIDAASGVYNAPGTAGNAVIGVQDSTGKTATTNVTIVGPVNISPATVNVLASGTHTFTGSGGQTPYLFSVISGGGSVVSTTGVYTAPVGAGTSTVRITDALGQTADATVTVLPPLTISPATLAIAVNDTQTFTAAGGTGSGYSFSIVSGAGTIDSSSGLYTAPAATSTVIVRVTDSGSNSVNATVSVIGPLYIDPTTWEMAANNTKAFTGVGGQPPYTYSVQAGGGSIKSSTGT